MLKKYLRVITKTMSVLVIALAANLLLNMTFVQTESQSLFNFEFTLTLFLYSTLLLIPVVLLVMVLVNNEFLCMVIVGFTAVTFSIINTIKLSLRNEPFYPLDLSFAASLQDLIAMIDDSQRILIMSSIVLLGLLLAFGFVLKYKNKHHFFAINKIGNFSRGLAFLLAVSVCFYLGNFNNGNNAFKIGASRAGFYDARWDQKLLYETNGFVLGFVNNFSGKIIETPANYNQATVEKTLDKYQASANLINHDRLNDDFEDVSVIYILSESFSDPNNLEGLSLNANPATYVANPSDKAYSGEVVVPSYGGGTPNSEFEVLTSLNVQDLIPNMSLPFQDFLHSYKTFPSIVSDFNRGIGNESISLHSFTDEMYKRPTVYQTLGFDHSYYRDNMVNIGTVESSIYVSDVSIYDETLMLLDEASENLFIHMVTMQNHAPYDRTVVNNDFKVTESFSSKNNKQIETFAHGVSVTDYETQRFIESISTLDRNVIVVFYGDHLPGLYGEYFEVNDEFDVATTPYFVYSNYSQSRLDIGATQSLTMMNNLVKDLADVRVNAFDALVHDLRMEIPAGRLDSYMTFEGDKLSFDELNELQKELIEDFKLIQYDILEGKQYTLSR